MRLIFHDGNLHSAHAKSPVPTYRISDLIRLIMIESALFCDVIPRQLSFKHTIQLWLTFYQQTGTVNIKLIKELLLLVGQLRVGNRT